MSVLRDGRSYESWRAKGPDAIEIDSDVADHRFEIATGWRGARAAPGEALRSLSERAAHRPVAVRRTSVADVVTALASVSTTCPCCAGVA